MDWSITLDGKDLTNAWAPVLIDISVTDKAADASDSCDLSVDDSDGKLRMPLKRMQISVTLDGAPVFKGFVGKVESSGSRNGERLLKVKPKASTQATRPRSRKPFISTIPTWQGSSTSWRMAPGLISPSILIYARCGRITGGR